MSISGAAILSIRVEVYTCITCACIAVVLYMEVTFSGVFMGVGALAPFGLHCCIFFVAPIHGKLMGD